MMSAIRDYAVAGIERVRESARAEVPSRLVTILVVSSAILVPILIAPAFLDESLRLDEAQSLWQTSRDTGSILAVIAGDVHVPLYHLVLHAWRLYTADTIAAARLLSLVFFVLSVPLLYLIGVRAYGRRVALFAVVLFALSPFMNWYGNEIRMYTMFVFLTLANQYFFLRIFSDREREGSQSRWYATRDGVWAAYAVTAVAGCFTHYFFFVNLLAQGVFYVMRRDLFPEGSLRRFLLTALILVGTFLPWEGYVMGVGTAGFEHPALAPPSTVDLANAFSQFLFGFQSDGLNAIVLSFWPVVVLLGLLALGRDRLSAPTQYFLTTVLFAFALTFFASFVLSPIFVSRYLIFTIPALFLVISSLFVTYTPRLRLAAQGALLTLVVLTLIIQINNPRAPVKEEYAAAVAFMNEHVTPQDTVLLSAPFTVYPVRYYYRGTAPIRTLPAWNQFAYGPIPNFDPAALPDQVAQATEGSQNAYLLLSYDQGYEEEIRSYFDANYEQLYAKEYSKDLTLYVYRLRYNTEQSAIVTALDPQANEAP